MIDSRALVFAALVLWGMGAVASFGAAEGGRYPDSGALDLDVRPGKTEVWVNGIYVGVADAYDGFPRYLWLDPGEVRVVLYSPGYRTIAREFTITSGAVTRIDTRLEKGESAPPETLFEKPTARADARMASDRARVAGLSLESVGRESVPHSGVLADLGSDPARLLVLVRPSDAAIYLDGRFLGTGEELGVLHAGLLIAPGGHVVEVVRPGFASRTHEFVAVAGEDQRLELELEPEEPP